MTEGNEDETEIADTLKESETKDAAVSRTVRLYEESYALVIVNRL